MAMALHLGIKTMDLYLNESFENNFWKNCLIQANLNSLNRDTENARRYEMIAEWAMGAWKHVATNERMWSY